MFFGLGLVVPGHAHLGDLALANQLLHRLPDFLPGYGPVDVVHLVKIDVVGLQALEAGFAGSADAELGRDSMSGTSSAAAAKSTCAWTAL